MLCGALVSPLRISADLCALCGKGARKPFTAEAQRSAEIRREELEIRPPPNAKLRYGSPMNLL